MNLLFDSFWRAAVQCLHPRVLLLSLLPLAITGAGSLALAYFFWEPAVVWTRQTLHAWELFGRVLDWFGVPGAGAWLAPLLVVLTALPVLILASLLVVALCMTPALAGMVAERRFPLLERRYGASFWQSVASSLGATGIALMALVASMPFWLVPPLVLVLPPLIWGWLTYRVMAFDALAAHADPAERRAILRRHRGPLLLIGIACGYLGAAPGIVWASGVVFAAAFVVLVPVAIWIYTLVFAFSSLWFLHYGLAALEALRASEPADDTRQGQPLALPDDPDILPDPSRRAGRTPPHA